MNERSPARDGEVLDEIPIQRRSVGTRISWQAILGGVFIALGIYLLLGILGTAVGLSASDRMYYRDIHMGYFVWSLIITTVALFAGGLVTSLFTEGEDKPEAVLSATIMWSVVCVILLSLGGLGMKSGYNAMTAERDTAHMISAERANREAGLPNDTTRTRTEVNATAPLTDAEREADRVAARKVAWYAFAGTWISMLAAALGGLVGAGPVFRIIEVRRNVNGTTRI